MNGKRAMTGFTLPELLVVLAAMAILVALAVGAYQDKMRESRRSEGRSMLLDASNRELRFFADNETYTTNVTNLGYANPADSENGHYRLTVPAADGDGFTLTVTARGIQANDAECATLSIDNLGQKSSTGGGDCW